MQPIIDFWLPTSKQLNSLLGLDINSSICSDDHSCWERRILEIVLDQQSFAVGNHVVYINDNKIVDVGEINP
jgi:hypothetical protein